MLIITCFAVIDRIKDTDCFLGIHDRKLYVLGLCRAISLGGEKPYVLNEVSDEILPSLLLIFEGLKRAYQSRAQECEEEESEDEEEDDFEGLFSIFLFDVCSQFKIKPKLLFFSSSQILQKHFLVTKMRLMKITLLI